MKTPQGRNHIRWLLIASAVVVAVVVYVAAFRNPAPGDDKEAGTSLGLQETETKLEKAEPVFQTSYAVDLMREPLKEPRYGSEHPLYFCVVFGKEGKNPMLGVVDESGGTDAGYDVAYVDENMNGDLTDDSARKFAQVESGSRAGELSPRFEFEGPFEGEESARYILDISSLAPRYRGNIQRNDYSFHWTLDTGGWNYFFINGKMKLFSSAADALKGTPVLLGGQCQWQISSGIKNGKPVISAGLKDRNGCTLRILSGAGDRKSPRLTLIQDGKVRTEENMKFG